MRGAGFLQQPASQPSPRHAGTSDCGRVTPRTVVALALCAQLDLAPAHHLLPAELPADIGQVDYAECAVVQWGGTVSAACFRFIAGKR
jgi:hypothetical protein